MERWLLVAESNCSDPSRVKEFNQWYDGIHVPDMLETEGFISATRYETVSPTEGRGKFLALYEIETDDIEQTNYGYGREHGQEGRARAHERAL